MAPSREIDLPLDRASLLRDLTRGAVFEYVPFYGHHREADGGLGKCVFSQWWLGHPFVEDGVTYATAEHYMMAHKALLFNDTDAYHAVLETPHPREVKAIGRSVQGYDDAKWAAARFDLITKGNIKKFAQHPELLEVLSSTRGQILVEASPMDVIWGVGLGDWDPKAHDPREWNGDNLLGFALTRARRILL